jgi:two-component system OmpR family response regulator
VLDRDRLLDLVQGREAHLFDRAVDNQVSRLRRKIEVDSRNPQLIQTVWGGGYMLAADVRRADKAVVHHHTCWSPLSNCRRPSVG